MQVEIWSDIVCPFCYIGKRKFEAALSQFPGKEGIQITWKSFQLSPHLKTDTSKNINQFLAEHKGISIAEAQRLHDYVTRMAAQSGLTYNFDKAVVANSFNAHRFSHFSKQYGKQNEAEEKLFHIYFTEGKNIDNYPTLLDIGKEIGLDVMLLKNVLENNSFAEEVQKDMVEAQQLGVRGVPFFVFNRKFAVSGAQDVEVFLSALEKAIN